VGAAAALGAVAEVSEVLLDATDDPHPNVRRAAVQGLARWSGDPRTVARLEARRADSDADVRAHARRAFGGTGAGP
jgi:HEAT repeat protein